ncbi:MAG TPA: flagellin [Caulobacteraceae bacterium]|nr:flagellin [Caulobacteraceae bacterium]
MDQISTASSYAAVVANLNKAQKAINDAGTQISTGENATDLKGYAAHDETLIAMQSLNAQVSGYLSSGQILTDKLSNQNTAITQIQGAASQAVHDITNAIASGDGSSLMQILGVDFQNAVNGLNTTYNGSYMFSGGQVQTQPFTGTSMASLTASPLASLFHNDQDVTSSQINQKTTIQTGFLASQLGTPLMTAFQQVEAFAQGPNGPFSGPLTTTQITFLNGVIANFNTASQGLTTAAAQNGLAQSELTSATTDLTNQQTTLQNLMGDITNANMAQASANLQQAQLALQASSQVFINLNSSSLLNVLTAAGQ